MNRLFVFLSLLTLASCGPELNEPASTSVTGKWQTADSISYFYNLKMDVTQTPGGDLSGGWTSLLMGGHLTCPERTTCNAANTVSGRNTVTGVSIEVLGIGKFTGQLENGNVLRGDIDRFDGDFKVKFTKIP
jgi:hypothetical protein